MKVNSSGAKVNVEHKMQRAGLYLRFSDLKQRGGVTIEIQEESCRKHCEIKGYIVGPIDINEGRSADGLKESNVRRIRDLLEFAKEHRKEIDVLVVYNVSRDARDVEQHYYIKGELLKMGIRLESATEPIDNSPIGRFLEVFFAGKAQLDNDLRRETSKVTLWARVDQGLWPWQPPVGYKPQQRPEGVKLLPHIKDDTIDNTVKKIVEMYSTGLYSKEQLSKVFSKQKFANWRGRIIKFSPQTIDNMVNNPYYFGFLLHDCKMEGCKKDGTWIKGQHERLLDLDVYKKCQEVQHKRANLAPQRLRLNPDFPLRPFVLCGDCKRPLTACWSTTQYGRYAHYYCRNKDCAKYSRMIEKTELENAFFEYLKSVKPTDKTVARFKDRFIKRYEIRKDEISGDYLRQMSEIASLEQEQKQLLEVAKKGLMPEDVIKQESDELQQKITLAKLELTEKHSEELDLENMLSSAYGFIRTIENIWIEAPFEFKIKIQQLIFPEKVFWGYLGLSHERISRLFSLNTPFDTHQTNVGGPTGSRTPL